MQEHEHIYEPEQPSSERTEQTFEEANQAASEVVELVAEMWQRRRARRIGRGLVAGLLVSFLASAGAFWLSGTLLSAPTQIVPFFWLQILAEHRLVVISVPILCLIACYIALRALTGEIMAVPERYLDERQKLVRDQAHRSAFKFVKWACFAIPVAFVLPHLPWFNAPAPVATPPVALTRAIVVFDSQGSQISQIALPGSRNVHFLGNVTVGWRAISVVPTTPPFSSLPVASTVEVAVAGVLLLLVVGLTFAMLPMAVLAWQGQE